MSEVSEFVAGGEHNKNIQSQLKGLARPSLGMFASLIRELAKHGQRSKCPGLQMIDAFYNTALPTDAAFRSLCFIGEMFDYKTPKKCNNIKQLIDVLVIYRNKGDAHAVSRSRKDYLEIIPKLLDLIRSLLDAFRPLGESTLLRVEGLRSGEKGEVCMVQNWNAGKPTSGIVDEASGLALEHIYVEIGESDGEKRFVDLYPFFYVERYEFDESGSAEIYSLNEIKKSKLEFVNFQTGAQLIIKADNPQFAKLMESATTVLATDPLADGYNPILELGVSAEAEMKYSQAVVSLKEEYYDTAIMLLHQAVADSPLFREALLPLSQLQVEEGDPIAARETLKEYLELFPNDLEFLLADAKALLAARDTDGAQMRIEQIRELNADHPELKILEERRMEVDVGQYADAGGDARKVLLPYHVISAALCGDAGLAKRLHMGGVGALTAVMVGVFAIQQESLMALTMASFGLLWLSILWANFRMWAVLEKSENNFTAFLRSRNGRTPSAVILDIICPILGCYSVDGEGRFRLLLRMYRDNMSRFNATALLSVLMTAWFLGVSVYNSSNTLTDSLYALYTGLFSLSFLYLLTCLTGFQRALVHLRKMKSVSIHFNIVQHPKLSVRYLSSLSRRVLFPMLVVYILFTFTFYLGPFLANLALVVALTLLILFLCFSYYSTIFLVRSIIIQSKWRLISQFSTHFHTPFSNLVTEGQTDELNNIKKLLEARDFIDSIDVWAEKKIVLLGMSLLFLGVLVFSTIGLSNIMTRHVVPVLSRAMNKSASEVDELSLPSISGNSTIEVSVGNVDDTFLVLWGPTRESLRRMVERGVVADGTDGVCGIRRCDWQSAAHGTMDVVLPTGCETHVLLVGYNKVYKGMLGMGGGKYSHSVEVSVGDEPILISSKFIRINTKEVSYMAYLDIRKTADGVAVHREMGPPLANSEIGQLVGVIAEKLDNETAIDALGLITEEIPE